MKFQSLALVSAVASTALARPRALEGPISQASHVTAFVITDEGVKVECWQIGNLLPDSVSPSTRRRGQRGPSVLPLYNDELQGVDLLTWPEPVPLWPPPKGSSMHSKASSGLPSGLYTIQTGLVDIRITATAGATDDDDDDDWGNGDTILSAENGDNWFYFEDTTTGDYMKTCAHAKDDAPPLSIAARSADGTTLIQFKYDDAPAHEVLHPGRCRFSGLVNVGDDSSKRRQMQDLNMEF